MGWGDIRTVSAQAMDAGSDLACRNWDGLSPWDVNADVLDRAALRVMRNRVRWACGVDVGVGRRCGKWLRECGCRKRCQAAAGNHCLTAYKLVPCRLPSQTRPFQCGQPAALGPPGRLLCHVNAAPSHSAPPGGPVHRASQECWGVAAAQAPCATPCGSDGTMGRQRRVLAGVSTLCRRARETSGQPLPITGAQCWLPCGAPSPGRWHLPDLLLKSPLDWPHHPLAATTTPFLAGP